MADKLEENGQGWVIQGVFDLDTRIMFWRERLGENLRKDDENHNNVLLPTLAKSPPILSFFPILITVLCFAVVLLWKNCILGIYEEIHKSRKKKKREKQFRRVLYHVDKPINYI